MIVRKAVEYVMYTHERTCAGRGKEHGLVVIVFRKLVADLKQKMRHLDITVVGYSILTHAKDLRDIHARRGRESLGDPK